MNDLERYKEEICKQCKNRNSEKDLCKIIRILDNSVRCESFIRCKEEK